VKKAKAPFLGNQLLSLLKADGLDETKSVSFHPLPFWEEGTGVRVSAHTGSRKRALLPSQSSFSGD